MFSRILFLFLFLTSLSLLVSAQFNFFEQMFGGHPQGHQQQQQQQRQGSQWAAHADQTQCSQYLCPLTLLCVARPIDCPCPSVEDIKCIVPDLTGDHAGDGTVLCVRGEEECAEVERLMRRRA